MFFFKPKPKEILPPPSPFPEMELGKELAQKDEQIDEAKDFPEEDFNNLAKDLGKSQKKKIKKEKKAPKAIKSPKKIFKKQKTPKKVSERLNKSKLKKIKAKTVFRKGAIKNMKKGNVSSVTRMLTMPANAKKTPIKRVGKSAEIPELEGDLGLDMDFSLPKEIPEKEIELPETLEGFDVEDSGFGQRQKPMEILEAQEEIKSAIEKIKKHEKPSFFRNLFAKKEKAEEPAEILAPETDDMSVIQNKLVKARKALMDFDLESAKKIYMEVMGIYNRLSQPDKSKIYNEIREFYFERKNAEQMQLKV